MTEIDPNLYDAPMTLKEKVDKALNAMPKTTSLADLYDYGVKVGYQLAIEELRDMGTDGDCADWAANRLEKRWQEQMK